MVATRRGTRVGSPVKSTSDESAGVTQPTPSTRRTRRRTLIEENQSQSDSQPDEPKDDSTASSLAASPPKRDTRRSTRLLANKKQTDSTHEADVSESESCCSVASDVLVTPRTRRRTVVREKRVVDEASEAESCSSAVSATRSHRVLRSLRKRVLTSAASKDDAKDFDEDPSGAESCSSAVSLTKGKDTQRLTRSQRRTTEADQSEPDSCSSSVSGLRGSVVRRSTRNQKVKVTETIPISLEETTDTPSSPVSRNLRGRRHKTEDDEYESDECKSGPSTSPWRSTRHQPKVDIVVVESDSESVATDICTSHGSPSPQRGKGTPCSSRTGSASSNRAVPVIRTRSRAKAATEVTTAATMPEEQKEGEELDRDKAEEMVEQLDSTVTMETSEVQECTIIEEGAEDTTVVFDQDEPVEPKSCAQDVAAMEDQGTETSTLQEQPVTETIVTLPEDKQPDDVAMENEPELEETSNVVEDQTSSEPKVEATPVDPVPDVIEKAVEGETCPELVKEGMVQAVEEDPVPTMTDKIVEDQFCSEPVKDSVEAAPEDPEPAVVEEKVEWEKKDIMVIEESNDTINTTENDSVTLNDLEGPSTSSHIQVDLSSTEETHEEPSSKKEIISLLDSSEDEDSADEGLSSGEEGCAQEAEDAQSEDDGMSPDENQMSEEEKARGNGLFVIDTRPGLRPEEQYYVENKQTEEEDEEDFVDEEGDEDDDEDSKVLFAPKKALMQLSSSIDTGLKMKELGGLYISFDGKKPKSLSNSMKIQKDPDHPEELLKKSVIVPDFEKKDAVPPYKESKQAAKLKRKAEREKTTGDGWFNMRAPEVTEELKNDLKALKMRSAMDPKHFYKKNDREGFPKYFQVGTVVDSPVDFYNSRIPKKQRKRTIVEELLADAKFRSSNKKKYQEIMAEKAAQAAGKQHKKKHKFHKKKMNK